MKMKKIFTALYFMIMSLIILSVSGCGGGHNNSVGSEPASTASYKINQVAVLTSPALEMYKDYKIFTSIDLEGMDTAQFYVANIGDDSSQATLNLGLSTELNASESIAIINASTGAVVFAYNPSGTSGTCKIGGNVFIRSNGKFMHYRTLTIDESEGSASVAEYPAGNTNGNYKYYDADVISGAYQTERGVTAINIGTGSSVSFIENDEDTRPRNINTSGDVFKLNRKVNTFSGIIFRR